MARPVLTKATPIVFSSITNINNWKDSASALTPTQILSGSSATEYVFGTKITGAAGPLTLAMSTFTPSASEYVYGLMIQFRAFCSVTIPAQEWTRIAVPYLSVPIRLTTTGGVRNFSIPARNVQGEIGFDVAPLEEPLPTSTLGDTRAFFLYNFDTQIPRWNLAGTNQLEIFVPPVPPLVDDVEVVFREVVIYPLVFTPTTYVAYFSPPPHIWDPTTPGVSLSSIGGMAKPSVGSTFFQSSNPSDVPDVVRVVYSDAALAPQEAIIEDFGLIVPRPDDKGLVVPRVDFVNPDSATKPTGYIHMSSGWLSPAMGDYYWSNWSTIKAEQTATRPVVPVLTAVINGDQVDFTGHSCDNLLPALASGVQGTVDVAQIAVGPAVTATVNTLSFTAPYDGTQRTGQVIRVTRNTSIGDITLSWAAVPVQASKVYAATCFFRTSVAATVNFNISWYTSGTAFISTSTVATSAGSTSRVQLSGTVTTPGTAAYAIVQIVVVAAGIATTFDVDSISFNRYNGASIPAFNAGGYIWGNAANFLGSEKPLTFTGALHKIESDNPTVGTVTEVTTAPRIGTHHLQYVSTGSSTLVLPAHKFYLPEALPTTICSARAWVRSVTTAGRCTLGLRFMDSTGATIHDKWGTVSAMTSTSTYASFKCEGVTIPDGAVAVAFLLGLPTNSAITYYIDSICLQFKSTLTNDGLNTDGYGSNVYPLQGCVSYLVIERQLANSTTWTPILIKQVSPNSDVALSDYVVPEGMTFKYRARVLGLMDGLLHEGQYTSEISLSTSSPGLQWTLWDPSDDANGPLRFDINGDDGSLGFNLQASLAMYAPIGRNRRVLTRDTSKGRQFAFQVELLSAADFALWEIYHVNRDVLILTRTSTGECWSVVISSDMQVLMQNTTPIRYIINVTLEQVDEPPVW